MAGWDWRPGLGLGNKLSCVKAVALFSPLDSKTRALFYCISCKLCLAHCSLLAWLCPERAKCTPTSSPFTLLFPPPGCLFPQHPQDSLYLSIPISHYMSLSGGRSDDCTQSTTPSNLTPCFIFLLTLMPPNIFLCSLLFYPPRNVDSRKVGA